MKKERTDLDALRTEIEDAERRVAREIDPGARALVVAILVFVLLGSFILPHTGDVRGWDVLFSSHGAGAAAVALPSRVFTWLALVFGVGFSMLALMTRRASTRDSPPLSRSRKRRPRASPAATSISSTWV